MEKRVNAGRDTGSANKVPRRTTRRGVVGVIVRGDRFLLIRRSQHVTAPGFVCFAGGGIEAGETEQEALIREMQEELGIDIQPTRRIWESRTRWGIQLGWWLIDADDSIRPVPNPEEVEETFWLTKEEIAAHDDLLGSMPEFLQAWDRGDIEL